LQIEFADHSKAMSKASSIFHTAKFAGIVGILAILSGCAFLGLYLPPAYSFMLSINNKLTTEIASCTNYEVKNCQNIIPSGMNLPLSYISQAGKPSDESIAGSLDQAKIKICDKAIDVKRIKLISPIIKHSSDQYEIVIDKTVADAFC